MPKVVRILSPAGDKAIRVDRATDWGNPFIMKKEADRERVCDQYEAYAQWRLAIDPTWLDPLRGKDLACWCTPRRCHAETLIRLANLKERS